MRDSRDVVEHDHVGFALDTELFLFTDRVKICGIGGWVDLDPAGILTGRAVH